MSFIAIVVREISYLKVLSGIINEVINLGQDYIIYHRDVPMGQKEYNRADPKKLKIAHSAAVKNAKKVKAFTSDEQLMSQIIHDSVNKVISLEVHLWLNKSNAKKISDKKVKIFNILYLSDSLWGDKKLDYIHKTYHTTEFLMNTKYDFIGKNPGNKDISLGSPIFDGITDEVGKDILVLLPNLREEHVQVAFGSKENFIKIISKLSDAGNLIFKTRKKQWFPKEIEKFAKEIVSDGDQMDPPVIKKLLKNTYCSVLFMSSGIYECVYGGNYILNIPMKLKRWGWDQKKLKQYFSNLEGSLYQFTGAVESVDQKIILDAKWEFEPRKSDEDARKKWISKFIGTIPSNSAEKIVEDILKSV